MNQQSLSSFIWSVADLLRGDYKQSERFTQVNLHPDKVSSDEIVSALLTLFLWHTTFVHSVSI
jgi:hypothetical protein